VFKPQDSAGELSIGQACVNELTKKLQHVSHVLNDWRETKNLL